MQSAMATEKEPGDFCPRHRPAPQRRHGERHPVGLHPIHGKRRASPAWRTWRPRGPPGIGNPGRMDLYVHNTCIEFKTDILRNGAAEPGRRGTNWTGTSKACSGPAAACATASSPTASTTSCAGWARRNCRCVAGRRTAPLTGRNRRPGCGSTYTASSRRRPRTSAPRAENLQRCFGSDSDAFRAGNLLLQEAYAAHRDDPTVAVKRRLWQDLLQGGPGQGRRHGRRRKRTGCSSGTPTSPAWSPSSCSSNCWATWPATPPKGRTLCSKGASWPNSPTCTASSTPTCSPGPRRREKARICGKSPASSSNSTGRRARAKWRPPFTRT